MKGTEKQIAWANKIVAKFVALNKEAYIDYVDDAVEKNNMEILLDRFVETHQDAAWWIEFHKSSNPGEYRKENVAFCNWMDEIEQNAEEMAYLVSKGVVIFEEE